MTRRFYKELINLKHINIQVTINRLVYLWTQVFNEDITMDSIILLDVDYPWGRQLSGLGFVIEDALMCV